MPLTTVTPAADEPAAQRPRDLQAVVEARRAPTTRDGRRRRPARAERPSARTGRPAAPAGPRRSPGSPRRSGRRHLTGVATASRAARRPEALERPPIARAARRPPARRPAPHRRARAARRAAPGAPDARRWTARARDSQVRRRQSSQRHAAATSASQRAPHRRAAQRQRLSTSRARTTSARPRGRRLVLATRSTRWWPRALRRAAVVGARAARRAPAGVAPRASADRRGVELGRCSRPGRARRRALALARAEHALADRGVDVVRGPGAQLGAVGRWTSTSRSMRSSSGPLSRRRWRATGLRAAARAVAVAGEAAGARVRRRDEHQPGREHGTRVAAHDDDLAVLERLAQRLQARARGTPASSSRNSTPRWARLTSPGAACAPPPTRPGEEMRVVRRAERPLARRARRRACRPATLWMRVTSMRLVARQRRQDARETAREHRLAACPGGPSAGGCGRRRRRSRARARRRVPATSARSASAGRRRGQPRAGAAAAAPAPRRPPQHLDRLAQRRRRRRPRAPSTSAASARAARAGRTRPRDAAPRARPPPRRARRATGRSSPLERQLAEDGPAVERVGRALAAGGEQADRERQVEARPRLAQVRRREVRGDPPRGELEVRVERSRRAPARAPPARPRPPGPTTRKAGRPGRMSTSTRRVAGRGRRWRRWRRGRARAGTLRERARHGTRRASQRAASPAGAPRPYRVAGDRRKRVPTSAGRRRSVAAMSSDLRHRLGRAGEQLAAEHLERRGFAVLARNHRTRCGELDLIAADAPADRLLRGQDAPRSARVRAVRRAARGAVPTGARMARGVAAGAAPTARARPSCASTRSASRSTPRAARRPRAPRGARFRHGEAAGLRAPSC